MTVDNISDLDFGTSFKSDYYDYGMSVIEERALPDVRDGLKPVHRAILFEMLQSNITSKSKPVKVAKTTGAVIGKYHPHGDSAVEDALAGMAAPWKNSMPAIEIKGNGGSVYGDRHAAGRYIEAKLTPTGDAYGKKLKNGIVPYEPNFDDTTMIPKVLPAGLPYLLINGSEGIAVGVANTIPTHNPIEVIHAFLSYVKNPKQSVTELMEILPGPDFPTKGEIINKKDLPEIYETGLGRIRVRGKLEYNKKENALHVVEIPFTASGSMDNLVEKIANATLEQTNSKGKRIPPKIKGVNDVKDHSGKDGLDITIKLKRGIDPDAITKELFAKTPLETTLKFDFSALNNRRLKRYGLKSYFKDYLAFQHETVTNEFTLEKQDLENRLEIIKGLLILQKVIDEVVSSARNSNGKKELREVLETGKVLDGVLKKFHKTIQGFAFSELQSEYIANLPIYKINKMDYASLIDEGKKVQKDIDYATGIIESKTKRKNLIIKRHKNELKNLDEQQFARKTSVIDDEVSVASKLEIPETDLYVSMDKYQYVRIEEKKFDDSIQTTNKSRLGFIDKFGVCWNLHLEDTQVTKNNGTLVTQLIKSDDVIVGWTTTIMKEDDAFGLFIFEDGNMKLTDMRKYQTKTKATKVASGRSKVPIVRFIDVPSDAVGVTINGKSFRLDDFSVQGPSGHGRNMMNTLDHADIEWITDDADLPTSKPTRQSSRTSSDEKEGVVYFDASDQATFNWDENEPSESDALFAMSYKELLTTELLFVHDDGRAKRVSGKEFEVKTRRSSIKVNKTGCVPIYIGRVPETMLAHYTDGSKKRVETSLISKQGKAGGGIRAFASKKHTLERVEDGKDSDLDCVSLATQPK